MVRRPSVRSFVRLPVRPFARPFARPSTRPSVHLRPPVRPSGRLADGPSVRSSARSSVRSSVPPPSRSSGRQPSDGPSVRPSVRPSVHPSIRSGDWHSLEGTSFAQSICIRRDRGTSSCGRFRVPSTISGAEGERASARSPARTVALTAVANRARKTCSSLRMSHQTKRTRLYPRFLFAPPSGA